MENDGTIQGKRREAAYDILKGIGIVWVILGHMPGIIPPQFRYWIFSFHMPAFFFVSGHLCKVNKNTPIKTYTIKKIRSLLLPYAIYSGIFLLIETCLKIYNEEEIKSEIINILVGYQGVQWYLISLMWTSLEYIFIIHFVSKKKIQRVIILLLFMMSYFINKMGVRNFFQIFSSFIGLGYYYIGTEIKTINTNRIKCFIGSVLISILGSIIIICLFQKNILDMKVNYEFDIILTFSISCGGIYLNLYIANLLNRHMDKTHWIIKIPIKYLEHIGRYYLIFFAITWFVPKLVSELIKETVTVKIVAYIFGFIVSELIVFIISTLKSRNGVGKQ